MITIFKKQKKEKKEGEKKEEEKKETSKGEGKIDRKDKNKKEGKTSPTVLSGTESKFESWRVIDRPIISEKATFLEEQNKYVFKIANKANKNEVKKAIEALYRVKVKKITIINVKRKKRRLGRIQGYKSGYKKAIVTLEKGHKIEVVPR